MLWLFLLSLLYGCSPAKPIVVDVTKPHPEPIYTDVTNCWTSLPPYQEWYVCGYHPAERL